MEVRVNCCWDYSGQWPQNVAGPAEVATLIVVVELQIKPKYWPFNSSCTMYLIL